ncbi:MAG TPA: lipopolysaccharide heptosyltransferase II [bacterium]|nr:lipopolysaccharide heptosyltransferase II [bacterium]
MSQNHSPRRHGDTERGSLRTEGNSKTLKILVRVPNWLGDTLMSTPAVTAVRRMFPQAHLTILAKPVFEDFWKNFPGVDDFIPVEKGWKGYWATAAWIKAGKFDKALVLPTSFSSAFLLFLGEVPERIGWGGEGRDLFLTQVVPQADARQRHLVAEYLALVQKGLGRPLRDRTAALHCPVPQEAKAGLQRVWKDMGVPQKGSYIALAPGATYGPAKRWPLAYWKELMGLLLAERKENLLILGGLEEEAYLKPLTEGWDAKREGRIHLLAGRTTPSILGAMLARCRLLITNDTGPMHVAAGVGTPTVSLFGSTSPDWTRPFGKGHEVIYKHLECSPCFQRTCPIGYKCLHAISVNEVHRTVLKKLKGRGKIGPEIIAPRAGNSAKLST